MRDEKDLKLYHEAVLVGDVGTDAVLVWLAGKIGHVLINKCNH
jgi:hypothetical protein